MKKILLSLGIIFAVAAAVTAGTGAFLSDTETAVGNTFTAGAIDLKVDNESYYNGVVSEHTSFGPSDLDDGKLFIDFRDLKPDDEGEDTISLHVNNNDAYLCMDMSLTSNDDISSNEPELETGDPLNTDDAWDGELGDLVKMIWWVDDGDNVLEVEETLLNGGVKSVKDFFGEDEVFSADLADATTNVWTPNTPGPVIGGQDYYIAKAWCFGTMAESRVAQDGSGHLLNSSNGPLVRGTGITCDGKALNNASQTDGVTMDIAFRAIQARHNPGFTCENEQPRTAKLNVIKKIINDNGGNNIVSDFQLQVVGTVVTNVTSGATTTFAVGPYIVTETGIPGYLASFSGDCDSTGNIILNPGEEKTCVITNNDLPTNITVVKLVTNNNGGIKQPVQFPLLVNGALVQNNTATSTLSNIPYTINETQQPGYHFVSMTGTSSYGKSCPAVLGGSITLDEGENIVCTITNDDD